MDLLKNNDEYDAGHYNNINEFKYFVENIKNDGVPVEPLSKEELSHFIFSKKDIKNKYVRGPYYDPLLEKVISSTKLPYKAYIYPVIKDELSNTLPAYLALYETYSALDNKMRILISEKKLSSLHHPNLKSLKKKHQFPDKNKLRNYSNF